MEALEWSKCMLDSNASVSTVIELHHEKTCLRGFRPGSTQTGLYSHRIYLEA